MCFHICTCIFTYINTHMYVYKFSSISQSCPTLCDPTDCSMPGFPVHHQLPELTQTMSIDQWCHLSISSSVIPRSSCLQSLPASRYVQWVSALHQMAKVYWSFSFSISASNEYSGLIPFRIDWLDILAVQRLSRVFSNTTVQKHQFFGTQLSLWSNSHDHTWLLEKPYLYLDESLLAK